MILTIKNKKIEVKSLEQASLIFCEAREKSGHGASRWPDGKIFDASGKQTHHVSYNGKVWLGEKHIMGGNNVTVFDPRA